MLAELRETTIQELAEVLASRPELRERVARLEKAGVDGGKLFASALKRSGGRGPEAARKAAPALDGSWTRALRSGRVAASLHSVVVKAGDAFGFGYAPCKPENRKRKQGCCDRG